MIRNRLAALILTAGLGFFSGCTALSPSGSSGGGLFSHCHNGRNCASTVAGAPVACCPTSASPACCPTCAQGFDVGGDFGVPEEAYAVAPSCPSCGQGPSAIPLPTYGAPTVPPPPFPQLNEPPLGSNTKFSPMPQAVPIPYYPGVH